MRLRFGFQGFSTAGGPLRDPLRPVLGETDRLGVAFGLPQRGRRPGVEFDQAPFVGQPAFGIHLGAEGMVGLVAHRVRSYVAGLETLRAGELANLAPAASTLLTGHPRRTFRVPPVCLIGVSAWHLVSIAVQRVSYVS